MNAKMAELIERAPIPNLKEVYSPKIHAEGNKLMFGCELGVPLEKINPQLEQLGRKRIPMEVQTALAGLD